jgi:hypothetical protein
VRQDGRDTDRDREYGSTAAHQNLRKNSGKAFPWRRSSVSVLAGMVSGGRSGSAVAALDWNFSRNFSRRSLLQGGHFACRTRH